MINNKTAEAVAEIAEYNPGTEPFCYDMEHFFAPLTLRVFSTFCTGKDIFEGRRDKEKEVCKVVTVGSYWMGVVMFLKLPTWRFLPWTRALDHVLDTLRPEIMQVVDSKRVALKNGNCDSPDDCVSQMIMDDLSEKEIFDHMVTLLCAGHDTTAFFSAYMCLVLAQHADVQQKAYDEVIAVM
ncbi:cyp516B1, partial [Symbiodinium microadriaticum]